MDTAATSATGYENNNNEVNMENFSEWKNHSMKETLTANTTFKFHEQLTFRQRYRRYSNKSSTW